MNFSNFDRMLSAWSSVVVRCLWRHLLPKRQRPNISHCLHSSEAVLGMIASVWRMTQYFAIGPTPGYPVIRSGSAKADFSFGCNGSPLSEGLSMVSFWRLWSLSVSPRAASPPYRLDPTNLYVEFSAAGRSAYDTQSMFCARMRLYIMRNSGKQLEPVSSLVILAWTKWRA